MATSSQVVSVPTGQTGRQETLSEWAGPYVTSMLGKAQALSETPYQTYQGPLTAGYSPLQMQAFQGVGGLAPSQGLGTAQQMATTAGTSAQGMGYTPGSFSAGIFGTPQAQQYMNPYLQGALTPAMDELRRQTDISRTQQAGRLTQAGAFGGSRQAIMESELNRNLMDAQRRMLGEGYSTAYDKAMAQYNADMARSMEAQRMGEQSRQFGATYGLEGIAKQLAAAQALGSLAQSAGAEQRSNLAQQLAAGEMQRAIESEGIKADLAEFQAQRDFPYKQLQFQQSMLQGMPIQSVAAQYQQPTSLTSTLNTMGGLMDLYQRLFPTKK